MGVSEAEKQVLQRETIPVELNDHSIQESLMVLLQTTWQ